MGFCLLLLTLMIIDLAKLRKLRITAGWSQRQLAKEAGVSHSYVTFIEQGRNHPSESVTKKLADALSVPMDELIVS